MHVTFSSFTYRDGRVMSETTYLALSGEENKDETYSPLIFFVFLFIVFFSFVSVDFFCCCCCCLLTSRHLFSSLLFPIWPHVIRMQTDQVIIPSDDEPMPDCGCRFSSFISPIHSLGIFHSKFRILVFRDLGISSITNSVYVNPMRKGLEEKIKNPKE